MDTNLTFRISFAVFAIFFFVQRFLETKFHKRIHGRMKAVWLTKGLIVAHFFFFFGCLFEVYGMEKRTPNFALSIVGLVLFFIGFFIRRWVIHTLGPYWSIDIEMREKHPLIMTGPYAFCRHPNYLAIFLEVIGFCLVANAFITLFISLLLYIPLLVTRIKVEEHELRAQFNKSYGEYSQKVPLLIPFFKKNNQKCT